MSEAVFGLLRFLSDEREVATHLAQTDGQLRQKSPYDVSGGARVADRFVFNQMRNAQRIKVWPTDR